MSSPTPNTADLTAGRSCTAALRRRCAALLAATLTLGACLAISLTTLAAPAGAATVTAHDPFGYVHLVQATPGGIYITGWALDPDALQSNLMIYGLVDGKAVVAHPTSTVWSSVVAKYHSGPTPGFQITVPVPAGNHTVCIAAQHLGLGMDSVLRCVLSPVGRAMTSTISAAHSPKGAITFAVGHPSSVHVMGWATDPDYLARRARVAVYIDGSPAATLATTHYYGTLPSGAGPTSRWGAFVPVASGAHMVCLWAVNIGFGANTLLGCRALDTRAGTGISSSAPSTSILPKVVTEARKHIGQAYVWGAAGPSTFDCSGLVLYSYKLQGYTTPRVSEDQFRFARVIPASHALPGDVVFYHDSVGHVYHVGIYTGPSMTVAAIDPAEGVDNQSIWNPSSASYGSFTHT